MVKQSVVFSFLIVSGAAVLSRICGFFREASQAAVYGAGGEMDAFLAASSIIDMLSSLAGAVIVTAVVPVYGRYLARGRHKEGCRTVSSLLNILLAVSLFTAGICFLFAPAWVGLVAPGFPPERSAVSAKLLMILSPSVVLMVLVRVFSGILQAHEDFNAQSLAGLPFNLAVIAVILAFGPNHGISAAAAGVVAGFAGQVLILIPSLRRTGYRYDLVFGWRSAGLREIAALMLPVIMGTAAADLNLLIQRAIGSGLPQGSLAALNYAQKLVGLPNGILVASLVQVIYPVMSRLAAQAELQPLSAGENGRLRAVAAGGVAGITFMMFPVVAGMIALNMPLTRLAYQRGAFDENAVCLTAAGVAFYAAGLWGLSQRQLLNSAFYALEDTRTPMALTIAAVLMNVAMSFSLAGRLGMPGLALADSLTNTVLALISFGLLSRRLNGMNGAAVLSATIRILPAAVLAGMLMERIYLITDDLPAGVFYQFLRLAVSFSAGFAAYLYLCALLRVRAVRLLKEIVKKGRAGFFKKE